MSEPLIVTPNGVTAKGVDILNTSGNEVVFAREAALQEVINNERDCFFYKTDSGIQTLDGDSNDAQLRREVLFYSLSQRAAKGEIAMTVVGNRIVFSDDTGELASFELNSNGTIKSVSLNEGKPLSGNAYYKFFTGRLMGGQSTSNVRKYIQAPVEPAAPSDAYAPIQPDANLEIASVNPEAAALSQRIDAINVQINNLLGEIAALKKTLTQLSEDQMEALIDAIMLIYPESRDEFRNAKGIERYAIVEKYLEKQGAKRDDSGVIIVSKELLQSISGKLNELKAELTKKPGSPQPPPPPAPQSVPAPKLKKILTLPGEKKIVIRKGVNGYEFEIVPINPPKIYDKPATALYYTPTVRTLLHIEAGVDPLDPNVPNFLADGIITFDEAMQLGWTPQFYAFVNWNGGDGVDMYELQGMAGLIDRRAAARYGNPPSGTARAATAKRYMMAVSFRHQEPEEVGVETARFIADIEAEMAKIDSKQLEELRKKPEYAGMKDEQIKFLEAIKNLKLTGIKNELLEEMFLYINEYKKANKGQYPSEKQLFEHYLGLIDAASCNPEDQARIYGVVRKNGITMLPWSGAIIDIRNWYAGKPQTAGTSLDGDPGAAYDLQWLKEKWQYNGNFDTLMNLIEAGEWDQAYILANGYISELKQILAGRPKAKLILSEINKMYKKVVEPLMAKISGRYGDVNYIAALIKTGPDGSVDLSRVDGIRAMIKDYETFMVGSGIFNTPENIRTVSEWRKDLATGLLREAQSLNPAPKKGKVTKTSTEPVPDNNVRIANACIAKAEEIYGEILNDIADAESLPDSSFVANNMRRDAAMLRIEFAKADPGKADIYLDEALTLADKLPPGRRTKVYVEVFKYLFDNGRYAEAASLLGTKGLTFKFKKDDKSAKPHVIPLYNVNWYEAREIFDILSQIKSLAGTNSNHQGGFYPRTDIRRAVDAYLKATVLPPSPDYSKYVMEDPKTKERTLYLGDLPAAEQDKARQWVEDQNKKITELTEKIKTDPGRRGNRGNKVDPTR